MVDLIRLTPNRQFRRRAVGNCSALCDISKQEVVGLLGEWIFFNILNFEANKKKYICHKTSTASKLMIFITVLDWILNFQALFF